MPARRRPRTRAGPLLVATVVAALCAAPAATAKVRIWLVLGDGTPRVGQPITIVVHAARELDHDLRLVAVAPGKPWFDVVGRVTGDSSRARARLPRDGFEIALTRTAGDRWRGHVGFPRPGRWRLVVPSGAPVGITIPPPVVRTVAVAR